MKKVYYSTSGKPWEVEIPEGGFKTEKMHNPYSGRSWEVVIPDENMVLPPNAVIVIEDGEERMVSRTHVGMLKYENTMIINDPALRY